ncbi:MAG: hypothetical protein M1115_04000, partial [Actinobacteria bacterium]|nr:hypothetical protein [Actinomycetota bacterium]
VRGSSCDWVRAGEPPAAWSDWIEMSVMKVLRHLKAWTVVIVAVGLLAALVVAGAHGAGGAGCASSGVSATATTVGAGAGGGAVPCNLGASNLASDPLPLGGIGGLALALLFGALLALKAVRLARSRARKLSRDGGDL